MPGPIVLLVFLAVVATLLILGFVGRLYRRVGPNEALIVYGMRGTRIVKGAGTVVVPLFESYQELTLELMSFDVVPEQNLYTSQGVAVKVEAAAQIKVKSDPESIITSAEQFLSKPQQEREALIRLVMEGHLRAIVGLLTVEQMVKEREMVAGRVRETVADDLNKMGLEVISFTIKNVTDQQEYIINMGRPDAARIKRDADIAQAEAERDTAIRRAQASREAAIAQASADQERVIAQTASETRQAEALRDLDVKKAEYEAAVRQQQAVAEKAYDIASNQEQQKVVAEQVRIEQVEREEQIKVQQMEVQRREQELLSTVVKQAEAEQRRIETLAGAERQRLASEAAGHAEAIRLQGTAEADIVRAKGQAEAEAMHVRAEAFQEYNQAAVLDKLLTSMPELARAYAQSLAGVDKITVSTGDGHGTGPSALTGEITKMVAQVPELFETLTGMKVSELMDRLQGVGGGTVHAIKPSGNGGPPMVAKENPQPPRDGDGGSTAV